MPPRPTVDPDLIRDVLSEDPRPSAAEAAQIISELLGRPVSPALIRAATDRHKTTWNLGSPPTGGGSSSAMTYLHETALKPRSPQANALRRQLRCWERMHRSALPIDPSTVYEQRVLTWGANLLAGGQVVDCVDDCWSVRLAWPWELGHLWAQSRPRDDQVPHELRIPAGRLVVNTDHSVVAVTVTKEHERLWRAELARYSRA